MRQGSVILFPTALSGTEKGRQRTSVTKILLNFWASFLIQFCLKSLVLLVGGLELFRKFVGAVRSIFGLRVLLCLLTLPTL